MGFLKTTPIVTLLLAVAFAVAPFAIDPAQSTSDQFDTAVEHARALLVRNPRLAVDTDAERLLDPEWLAELREQAEATGGGGEVQLPARMVARSQAELDGLLAQAYEARRLAEPVWRLGVLDGETPLRNFWAHAFVRESWAGFALLLAVLLIVASPLERSWGAPLFSVFVALALPITAQGHRLLDSASGIPWAGPSGLAAALVGAYFIRSLGGQLVVSGFLVLPVWFAIETFVVRGFWLDDLGAVPWATLFGAIGLGAVLAAGIRILGVETKLDAAQARREKNGPNPVVIRAARLRSDGDPHQAFDLMQAAWREHRNDEEIAEVFYSIAVELGQPEVAAEAILPVMRSALKKGQVERALAHWIPLAQRRCEVRLEPTASVRLGEALLDAGYPDEALFSLRSALDAGASTAHAIRILNVARDLDPGLTRRAASVALADPGLDAPTRERLEPLAASDPEEREPAAVAARAPAAATRADIVASSAVERRMQASSSTSELTRFPATALDTSDTLAPPASAARAMAEAPAETPDDVLSHWNDRGALSTNALEGSLFGDDDIDMLDAEADFDDVAEQADSDRTPLLDATDELTAPHRAAEPAPALGSDVDVDVDAERTLLMNEAPVAADPIGLPSSALLRTLRAIDAVPVEIKADAVEIDADGRGKSRLPFARIEAVALAAVRGLGPQPVLILDCMLNWRDDIGAPLKLIRFRSDRFDPANVGVSEPGMSPVAALASLAGELHRASRAACLPSESILSASYPSFDSLEAYEREVLGAERELGAASA